MSDKWEEITIPKSSYHLEYGDNINRVVMFRFPENHRWWNWYFVRPTRMIKENAHGYIVQFYPNERIPMNRLVDPTPSKTKVRLISIKNIKEAFENVK